MLRVGVATKAKHESERKPANLVFLVDDVRLHVRRTGSSWPRSRCRILTQNLKEGDRVALVTYAGSTRVVLPSTDAQHKPQISNT